MDNDPYGKEPCYYELLRIPRDATSDQIKKAYRALVVAVHPDKQQDDESRESAGGLFSDISEAYEVLSDPARRQIYDVYGRKGLMAGLEVGNKLKSFEELRSEWAKFQSKQRRERVEFEASPSTKAVVTVDATALVHDVRHRHLPLLASSLPYIKGGQVHSSVHFTAGSNAGFKVGVFAAGQSRLLSTGQRILLADYSVPYDVVIKLSDRDQIEHTGSYGLSQFPVSLASTRQLTQNDTGAVMLSVTDDGPNLQLSFGRQLFDSLKGEFACVLSPYGVQLLTLELAKTFEKLMVKGVIKVGLTTSLSINVNRQVGQRMLLTGRVRVGTNAVDAEAGAHYHFDELTKGYCGLRHGLLGTTYIFKVKRAGILFEAPVLLTSNVDDWEALLFFMVVPPVCSYLFTRFVVRPAIRLWAQRHAAKERTAQHAKLRMLQQAALAKQRLMAPVIRRIALDEGSRNGLIVVKALYGDVAEQRRDFEARVVHNVNLAAPNGSNRNSAEASTSQQDAADVDADDEDAGEVQACLDVTLALQYLVSESRLHIDPERDKSMLLGFADMNPGGDNTLYVVFVMGSNAYQCEVADNEPLLLPNGAAVKVVNGSLASWAIDAAKAMQQGRS